MIGQYAHQFGRVISDLWLQETICDRSADQDLNESEIIDTRNRVIHVLRDLSGICSSSGLGDRFEAEIHRFEEALSNEALRKIAGRCDHLRERILDELRQEHYFRLNSEDALLFSDENPFGSEVAAVFPTASPEMLQAARCLALQQSTACVFHLMRGMEIIVQKLSRKLGVAVTPQTTWRQLTASMDAKIRVLPHATRIQIARRSDWQGARINLDHLGSAVRNSTMHPGSCYSVDQAKDIFAVVRLSAQSLCRLKTR